jgi:hypothetical protein
VLSVGVVKRPLVPVILGLLDCSSTLDTLVWEDKLILVVLKSEVVTPVLSL